MDADVRASGGRINLRTRSGSRDLHGRAFYFFRDEALNANSFRNNALGLNRLPLQEHVSGFTLSGPTRVFDSALFFFAFEKSQNLDSTLIDTLLPTASKRSSSLTRATTVVSALVGSDLPLLRITVTPCAI